MVEGMKLYEDLFDDSGVKKMVSLVNDLRAAGRRGQFQGKMIIIFENDKFALFIHFDLNNCWRFL